MILLIVLAAMNPFDLFPDSTDVTIRNGITDASITSVYYLAAGSSTLTDAGLQSPIPPGETAVLSFPCRYINRVILTTDTKGNYRRVAYSPAPYSDTLSISRADKEFGEIFDVILGTRPFIIKSEVPVPLTSIFIRNDSTHTGSIIGSNPLMTDELLFLWLDRDSVTIAVMDSEGNTSEDIPLLESDSVHTIDINVFLDDPEPDPNRLLIINALNGESIVEIEVYPDSGDPFLMDLSATPLWLWQSVSVPVASGRVEYIVAIDSNRRTYSINAPDTCIGAFVVDWWHLDFGFDFPERSN